MNKISLAEINRKLDALLLISKGILKTQIAFGKGNHTSNAKQTEEESDEEAE